VSNETQQNKNKSVAKVMRIKRLSTLTTCRRSQISRRLNMHPNSVYNEFTSHLQMKGYCKYSGTSLIRPPSRLKKLALNSRVSSILNIEQKCLLFCGLIVEVVLINEVPFRQGSTVNGM